MPDYILEVRNLKKYFTPPSGTLHAVDNVSFSIEQGKTLGLMGESGCGKSTIGRRQRVGIARALPLKPCSADF